MTPTYDQYVKTMEEMNKALIEGKKLSEIDVNTRDILYAAVAEMIYQTKPKVIKDGPY